MGMEDAWPLDPPHPGVGWLRGNKCSLRLKAATKRSCHLASMNAPTIVSPIFLPGTVLLGAAARRASHEIRLFKAQSQSGSIDGLQLSYSVEPSQQPTLANAAVAAQICSRGP